MSNLKTRVDRLEEKLKLKPKVITVVDWNLGDGKAAKEIAEIKKVNPDAKIVILKADWV